MMGKCPICVLPVRTGFAAVDELLLLSMVRRTLGVKLGWAGVGEEDAGVR